MQKLRADLHEIIYVDRVWPKKEVIKFYRMSRSYSGYKKKFLNFPKFFLLDVCALRVLSLVNVCFLCRVRNLKFTRNLKFATSKTLVNFMKKMMFLSKNWYFSVQKAIIYYTFNKSHHISLIFLVFSHVANFRYVANFRFLTLHDFGRDLFLCFLL